MSTITERPATHSGPGEAVDNRRASEQSQQRPDDGKQLRPRPSMGINPVAEKIVQDGDRAEFTEVRIPWSTRQKAVLTREEPITDPVFSQNQIDAFRKDDAAAGAIIAKIMTTLFTYTVVIMLIVLLWTLHAVS